MRFFTLILSFLFFQNYVTFGQLASNLSVDSKTVLASQADSTGETAFPISIYKQATLISQNLYNGRLYYVYDPRNDEHQFFGDRKWQKGVVFYDGQRFDSIPMVYDIVRDELMIRHFNGDHLLLQSEKVDYFLKDGHIFERLEAGTEINAQMRTGFYDILYPGTSKALVRRNKQRQEKIVEKRVIALFPEKDFYYIKKGDRYYSVRSKRSVLNLFPDKKKELKKALRDEKIKFKKMRDVAITKVVVTYDSLAK